MTEAVAPHRFAHAWRALRHRNFQLFFAGQTVSLIGTWMTRIATSWLVYRLTGSALLLGTIGFVGQLPTFLLSPFAGVIVDRMDRRTLLVWTQLLSAAQSLTMAALTLTHRIHIYEILALSALQGTVDSFDMPARQSFLVQMVGSTEDLSNAIALNSSMVNLARLVGPALAGFVIAAVGEGYCFAIDGVSFFAVIACLLMMHVARTGGLAQAGTMLAQLREGFLYVRDFQPIRNILLLFATISLMGMPFLVLMPIFASQVLHGGPHTLGYLMGASGAGGMVAALSLTVRRSVLGLTSQIPVAAGVFGFGLMLFGLSRNLFASLFLMVLTGFCLLFGLAGSNTVIQTLVPDARRGRVMSFYTMAFTGVLPFGSLLAGSLAQRIGAPHAVIVTGACCVGGALLFATQLRGVWGVMRPIYHEKGILAEGSTQFL